MALTEKIMFIAYDENNNRISIENATKSIQYFCPLCGEPLIIRAEDSYSMRKHFAHKRGTNCIDDWSHDMSEWHRSWQEKFPEECREVVIEKDGVKHRADVLINNTVIEFQHSPIKSEEIAKRNMFYLSCGYPVVWVFDAEGEIKNSDGLPLDPMQYREYGLYWKRPKQQFERPFPQGVHVFLDYSTEISAPQYAEKKTRILLWVENVTPEKISFYRLEVGEKFFYIMHENFLKQYGAISDPDILSIDDIMQLRWLIQQQSNILNYAPPKSKHFYPKYGPIRGKRL